MQIFSQLFSNFFLKKKWENVWRFEKNVLPLHTDTDNKHYSLLKPIVMDKTFLNYDNLYAALEEVFTEALENMEDGENYDWMIEGYCEYHTQRIMKNMESYVHRRDTAMMGNFANIRQDWEYIKDFVKSNVEPWGRFDDIVASVDNGTISDTDLEKFQEWCLDWFFTAFGTWGLKYNFQTEVSEQMYIDEREREQQ